MAAAAMVAAVMASAMTAAAMTAAAAAAAAMAVAVKSAVAVAGEGGRAEGVEMSEGGCPRSPPGGVKIMIEGLEAHEHDFTHLHD